MKKKVIFFGTPSFAVTSLDKINSKFIVDCVVTAPDKRSGRGRKLNQSDVKKYTVTNKIKTLQPSSLMDKEFINQIKDLEPDLIIVVAFRKLPAELFNIPKYGTINLHASLLPNYRGAAPINWCLINGEIKTGVTTFFINERIDQGDILLQKEIIIENKDDFGSLYIKLSEVGADLVIKTVEGIFNNSLNPIKQNFIDDLKLAPKLNSENTRIDWNQSINYITGQIKGLSPKPGAWTMIENGDNQFRMKILKAKNEKVSSLKNNLNGKIVIDNGELLIYNEHGAVNCTIIQLENKREMTAKELLNGLKFHENSRVY
ncbi:MAG: methionyl-tRNA formyltransferase [Cryomorphaceae bacterium]|nr:methionyl-tRNA formyltransferase [Cryomorphaceae bacterium]MBT5416479.1 methionyl-tRNA formyltransferase [Cryomorphaceae bacterium]